MGLGPHPQLPPASESTAAHLQSTWGQEAKMQPCCKIIPTFFKGTLPDRGPSIPWGDFPMTAILPSPRQHHSNSTPMLSVHR
jgi:hypothetical protein